MSTLRTNALEGMDAKNSITIVAGAGNITTTNVQEGLAKTWIELRTVDGGPVDGDSLNVSSLDDDATGRYTIHHTNSMGGVYYSKSMGVFSTVGTSNMVFAGYDDQSASQAQCTVVDEGNSAADCTSLGFTAHGDLA